MVLWRFANEEYPDVKGDALLQITTRPSRSNRQVTVWTVDIGEETNNFGAGRYGDRRLGVVDILFLL